MRCGITYERRAASDAQWISGAAGCSRIFFDVLDQMPGVDSRSQRAGRKLLGEDCISRAGYAAWKHQSRGWEGWSGKSVADRAAACALVSHLARRVHENACRNECHIARNRFQWFWRREPRG